jgi:hypothetical protein
MGLNNAERQALWRAKRHAEIERLRTVVAEQSEQIAEARREMKIAALERENATLKMALAHERKEHAAAKTRAAMTTAAFEETVEAQATIDGLLQRVRDLEEKLVYERLRKPATAKDKPSPPPDKEIAGLKEVNKELRIKLREMHGWYEEESRRKGIMPFMTYGKLMKCLHPDSTPTDAERNEACGLLGQWKQDADRARRKAA